MYSLGRSMYTQSFLDPDIARRFVFEPLAGKHEVAASALAEVEAERPASGAPGTRTSLQTEQLTQSQG